MRCARVKGLLSDYMDGLLDPERAALVQKHLAQCGKCQKELESFQALIHELRSLAPVKAPEGFLAGLHERLERDSWLTRLKAFFSIPVRIPMELATLATTIIIAFFIFHLIPFTSSHKLREMQEEKTVTIVPGPVVAPSESAVPSQGIKDNSGEIKKPVLSFKPTETTALQRRPDAAKGNIDEKEKIQVKNEKKALTAPTNAERRAEGPQTVQTPPAIADKTDRSQVYYDMQAKDWNSTEPQIKAAEKQEKISAESAPKTDHFFGRVGVEARPIQLVLHIGSDYDKRTAGAPSPQAIQSDLELPKKEEPQTVAAGVPVQNQPAKELSKSKAIQAGAGSLGAASLQKEDNQKTTEEEILVKIQNVLAILGGKTAAINLNKETRQPEFLNIEIPARNFPNFVAELNKIGILNIPAEQAVESYPQTLRIRLQLIVKK